MPNMVIGPIMMVLKDKSGGYWPIDGARVVRRAGRHVTHVVLRQLEMAERRRGLTAKERSSTDVVGYRREPGSTPECRQKWFTTEFGAMKIGLPHQTLHIG